MVVSSRFREATRSVPVLSSTKQPVPYVDFIMPGAKQPWPMVAACWSPAMPRMRIGPPNSSGAVTPNSPQQSCTRGSIVSGTPKILHSPSSQTPLPISSNMVRAALVASVACTFPPVRRHNRKLSMVPKASSPARALARAPSTLSSSQAILLAEKYGSSSSPDRLTISGSWPRARKASQASAVRRSCQTMAL